MRFLLLPIDGFNRPIERNSTMRQEYGPATFVTVDAHYDLSVARLEFRRFAKRNMLRCDLREAVTLVPCDQEKFNLR